MTAQRIILLMGNTLIITGGEAPERLYSMSYDRIIACDSGYDTAVEWGMHPDYVTGDFDSTSRRQELIDSGFTPCPHDKDWSDTELALKMLANHECYDLAGGGGGRMDHLMNLLLSFERFSFPRYWFTRNDFLISLEGELSLTLPTGTNISLFSLTHQARVSCKDLVWPLDDFLLDSRTMSLSNRNAVSEVSFSSKGQLFIRLDAVLAGHFFANGKENC